VKNKLAKLLPALTLVLTASTFINIAHAQQPTESGLNLTADQKVKLQNVCQAHQKQLSAVLTPEQQAQIPGAIPDPWNSNNRRQKPLNLTSAQQAKMDQIRDIGRSQMNDILTPKQQQQQKEKQQKKEQQQQGQAEFERRYGASGVSTYRPEN
jgi:Spy/CpxP family protein refolding chaperone